MWLKSRLCVFISIHGHRHAHLFLSVLFTPSLYFFLKSFFQLFLIPSMEPDENSMEDPLCNSSFESMVSLDYVTPDTGYEPKDMELADTNERSGTSRPPAISTSRTPSRIQPLSPTPTSTTMNLPFLAVVVDRTGQPVEVRSNSDHFFCGVRNVKSA